MTRGFWSIAIAVIGGIVCVPSFGQYSVPPATYRPDVTKAPAKATLLLPAGASALRITLATPTSAESDRMNPKATSADAKPGVMKSRRIPIGFARQVPAGSASLRLADLTWQPVGRNLQAAQVQLTSPEAAAIRIGLTLVNAPPTLQLRFVGSAAYASVFGPYPVAALGAEELYWSPVLEGDTGAIEIEIPAGTDVSATSMAIPTVTHMVVAGNALKQYDPRIGSAGTCELDVACMSADIQEQAATAINAVARMNFVDHGIAYLCSGTLLNDSVSSMTPYFFTANHCIDNGDADPAASKGGPAAAATTINTYWFFQTTTCNVHNETSVNFVQLAGGAKLVARSVDYDWALVKLNNAPPPGATFAAWNSEGPIATDTPVAGIHHPAGDLKKFSQGSVRGYSAYGSNGSYAQVQWTQGVTEGGSSGSGLFVLNPMTNYYELRGGLWGGESACSPASLRSGIDIYSRMDVALPFFAPSLVPDAPNPKAQTLVVEFYDSGLDDYFITANAAEISDLDAGLHPGWVRTGLTFVAYSNPAVAPPDAKPVCRFYVLPQVGDSHFYSADVNECAATATKFANSWMQESDAVFYIQVPDGTGVCPADTRPVFRFLNVRNQLHHRYTIEADVRDSIIGDGGWLQEGNGSTTARSVMCAPTTL